MYGHTSIGRSILVIDKYFKMFFKKALKKYDLNAAEGMVLLVLLEQDGKTGTEIFNEIHEDIFGKSQDQIIDELHYDKGVMTRTMQSLESKGYVIRNNNPDDSRSFIFTLTHIAFTLKPDLIAILKEWNYILLKDIDHLDVVKKEIEKMSQNAQRIIKGE